MMSKMKGRPKCTSPEQERARVEARLLEVGKRYLKGEPQHAIGDALGVSQVMISKDLTVLRKRWVEQSTGDFTQAKANELAKIDATEIEAREMWELSKSEESAQIEQEEAERKSKGRDGKVEKAAPAKLQVVNKKVKRKWASKTGQTYWFDRICWCIEMRCKIWGFYKQSDDKKGGGDTYMQVNVNGQAALVPAADFWAALVNREPNENAVREKIEARLTDARDVTTTDGRGEVREGD